MSEPIMSSDEFGSILQKVRKDFYSSAAGGLMFQYENVLEHIVDLGFDRDQLKIDLATAIASGLELGKFSSNGHVKVLIDLDEKYSNSDRKEQNDEP